jgi:hypothetical protein
VRAPTAHSLRRAGLRRWRNILVFALLAVTSPAGVAPCKGAVACAALRLREADRLRFLISGNAKGFALSFPEAE